MVYKKNGLFYDIITCDNKKFSRWNIFRFILPLLELID